MIQKNESILELLAVCSWWVSVLLSGASFSFLEIHRSFDQLPKLFSERNL